MGPNVGEERSDLAVGFILPDRQHWIAETALIESVCGQKGLRTKKPQSIESPGLLMVPKSSETVSAYRMVERRRIELPTFALRTRRSPS